jgi:ribonuclease D
MEHQYISTYEQLEVFSKENKNITWIAFDTEFVGEKRYTPLLCLIQAVTEFGVYVIDPLTIENLDLFLELLENQDILKITHAGENDYRVLNTLYGTLPKNLFDTQVAAGFLTGIYPISFQKIAERELKVRISKAFTVTDWETRPISPKQLKYAFNDVIYLPELGRILTKKLEDVNRYGWLMEELRRIENPDYYVTDPLKEALQNNLTNHLAPREQLFLIRLLSWRRAEAERKNYSKEMILPAKNISIIVKNMSEGKAALKQNRIISDKTITRYWDTFNELFQAKITDEEKELIARIPRYEEETPEEAFTTEFLYLLIRHTCMKVGVAHSMVLSKSSLKANGYNEDFLNNTINKGWRKELLGENLIRWISDQQLIDFEVFEDKCIVNKTATL